MQAKNFMTENIMCADSNLSVSDVAKIMQVNHIGSVPVCDQDKRTIGIITDRDIVLRTIACDKDPNITPVMEVMTRDVLSVTPDTSIYRLANMMAENQVRRILVIDNEKLVGCVSIADLAREEDVVNELYRAVAEISEPTNNV